MDLSWLANLNRIRVIGSVDRGQMKYQVEDLSDGRVFRVGRKLASALIYGKGRLDGAPGTLNDKDLLKEAHGFIQSRKHIGAIELSRRKPFNPLFIQLPFFEVAPYQPALAPLANWLVGQLFWLIFGALVLVGTLLASAQDWAILTSFSQVFSLSALASFAIIAPFLKIFHELGHVLVATRHGVSVRSAGVYLIALYPMPFVDCSNADLTANRNQRIAISLAGLLVDLSIAFVALILWHFAEGGFGKTLLGNIFVFSSISSLVFNANPLIKLDGYFAFSDLIGYRNLSTSANAKFKSARRAVTTFGQDGGWPESRADYGLIAYAIGSFLYRINILLTIAWLMLPRFHGFGLAMVLWAGAIMFLSPLFRSKPTAPSNQSHARSSPFWGLTAVVLGLALVFVQLPYRTVVQMTLDNDTYRVVVLERGEITQLLPAGRVREGDVLAKLDSTIVAQQSDLLTAESELLNLARAAVANATASEIKAVEDRGALLETQLAAVKTQRQKLSLTASRTGHFAPISEVRTGESLTEGREIGALYGNSDSSVLRGRFPDHMVESFARSDAEFVIRINGMVAHDTQVLDSKIVSVVNRDVESGQRFYFLEVEMSDPPATLMSSDIYLKVRMGKAPLYNHIGRAFDQLRQRYWDARSSG